jgi:anti-sigma B factor antagonist
MCGAVGADSLRLRSPVRSSIVETVQQEGPVKLVIETRQPAQREVELVLVGEIDYDTAQQLRAAITAALRGSIDVLGVNLAGVTFLDSTGVGTLVVARRICTDLGVGLQVRDTNPFVARLLGVVGVAHLLGVNVPPGEVTHTPKSRRNTREAFADREPAPLA